jgi:hypothetical protein
MYRSYSFTTSALDGGEWSGSCPGSDLPPGKGPPGTHRTGDWVGPRGGLDTDTREKVLSLLLGIEPRSPRRPARSQTLILTDLHRLRPTYILKEMFMAIFLFLPPFSLVPTFLLLVLITCLFLICFL